MNKDMGRYAFLRRKMLGAGLRRAEPAGLLQIQPAEESARGRAA